MTTATTQRQPELTGQTVVVIGGSAGIGLETARRARAEGAGIVNAAHRARGRAGRRRRPRRAHHDQHRADRRDLRYRRRAAAGLLRVIAANDLVKLARTGCKP